MPRDSFPTLKDGDPFPVNIAPPAAYVIDAANPNSPEVQDLLQRYEAEIRQYVEQQRRNYALSGLSQHKATYASADLDVTYLNQFGRERVTLTPRPTYPPPPAPVVPPRLPPRPVYVPGVKRVDVPIPIDYPCLLVLYSDPTGGDKYLAAIRMGDIDPNTAECGAPWYIGALPNQTWGGKRFRVNQLNLDGTGAILTPIDFTADANPTADSLILYTPLLANGAVTTTESVHMPIMNGNAAGKIYTALDVYQSSSGSFTRTGPGGAGAGVRTITNLEQTPPSFTFAGGMPYCISPDGDYYCDPGWAANDFYIEQNLGYSYPTSPNVNTDSSIPAWGSQQFFPAYAAPPTDYPVAGFKNFYCWSDTLVNAEPAATNIPAAPTNIQVWNAPEIVVLEDWSGDSADVTMFVLTCNAYVSGAFQILNIGYFITASGSLAVSTPSGNISYPSNVGAAAGGWYVDPTNSTQTWKQLDGGVTDYSGNIPYPEYQVPQFGGAVVRDSLLAVMQPITASTSVVLIHPGDGSSEGGAGAYRTNDQFADVQLTEKDWCEHFGASPGSPVVYGVDTPKNSVGDLASTAGVGDSLFEDLVDDDDTPAPPASPDIWRISPGFTPWVYSDDQSTASDPSIYGAVSATTLTASGSLSGDDPTPVFEDINAQLPQLLTITGGDPEETNNVSDAGYTESISMFGFNEDQSAPLAQTLLLEPFPPSLSQSQGNGRVYYSVEEDDPSGDGSFSSLTITTPFGTYTGMSQTSFDPWLHVSDGVYWAQGFAVDDTPYLFLNGQDFFGPLTKVLNCANTDIHALFMDVPLSVCMALGSVEVQPPLPDPSAPTYPTFWPRVQA